MLVIQPIAGRISDSVGAKRLTLVALAGFAACSVAAAMSPTFDWLVTARTAQAIFAAALSPSVQSMLRSVTSPGERGRAFGILGAVIGAGVVVGPLLGGQLVDTWGWEAIFWVNLPFIAVCAVTLSRVHVPRGAVAEPMLGVPEDVGERGRTWSPVFTAAFATNALSNFAQYGLLLLCPLVLEARDWDAKSVGRVLTAMTLGIIVMGPLGGRYGDRIGRRRPVMGGLAIAVVSVVLLLPSGAAVSVLVLVISLGLFGVGLGASTPGVSAAAIEAVPPAKTGVAAGWLSMSRYIGSIVSTWLLSSIVDDDGAGARTMILLMVLCLGVALLTANVVVRSGPMSTAQRVRVTARLDDDIRPAVDQQRLADDEAGLA